MNKEIKNVKIGLFLVILTLFFGITLGGYFGIAEDVIKSYISEGIASNPDVHDSKSSSKIWRYAQRSHFHATGIAAFSIGLVILLMFSSIKTNLKPLVSILIGLGGLYPLSWFTMFVLAPSIGRDAAHQHLITEILAYTGIGGLLLGLTILSANLFFNCFTETPSN
ncbi:MAG: hypothetical protein KAT04_04325 [Methylococcales bacterium]|nr:hypothetical protein [Methylococcales bacterium]